MGDTVRKTMEGELNVSDFAMFSSLNKEEMIRLNYDKSSERWKKGTLIYGEGSRLNGFYLISSGIVKVFKMGINGKEQIIRFAKRGDIVGYRSLISQELACSSAKVIDEAVLVHIPYDTLLFLIQNNWRFSKHMLELLCGELKESNEYITNLAQKSIRERLAEKLLLLKKDFELDNQNTLQISLSRIDLANTVGTATESVIRELMELKHNNVIDLQGRRIRILDERSLRRVAHL